MVICFCGHALGHKGHAANTYGCNSNWLQSLIYEGQQSASHLVKALVGPAASCEGMTSARFLTVGRGDHVHKAGC